MAGSASIILINLFWLGKPLVPDGLNIARMKGNLMSQWTERYSDLVTATRHKIVPKAKDMTCVDCGSQAIDRHHEDYSKPLEVVFLCKRCHCKRHISLGTAVKPKLYNFSKIAVGSYAVIQDRPIGPISALVCQYSMRTGETFKCFSWEKNVVVFRLK